MIVYLKNFWETYFIKPVKEQYLLNNGWKIIDYPFSRTHTGYLYSVYSHPAFASSWDLDGAIKLTEEILVWLM